MFLADSDMSDEHTRCVPLEDLSAAARAGYYVTKTLMELRRGAFD